MERRRQPTTTTGPGVVLAGPVAGRLQTINGASSRGDRRGRLNILRLVVERGAAVPTQVLLGL